MERLRAFWIAAILLLVACGGAPAPTAQGVIDRLNADGLNVTLANAAPGENMIPKSYRERQMFTIPSVAPAGGQVFVCDTKRNCDAIFAYFDAFKALAGPYLYQSPSGTVVLQLNSGLTPDEATKFEQVVAALP